MNTGDLIQKYPKIFQQYEGNPSMVNWYGVPEAWLPIIDLLCGSIQNYVDHSSTWSKEQEKFASPPQVICVQMKEKYGGLRFYTNGHDDIIEGMIQMAEYMCDNTCQDCGTTEDVGRTKGWVYTLCRTCVIKHGDIAMMNWESCK